MKNVEELPETGNEFKKIYWLKDELISICKRYNLPTSGSKENLLDYVASYIDGIPVSKFVSKKFKTEIVELNREMKIVKNYSSDENHRRFFLREIGDTFKFNVSFMNWMKVNSEVKTYNDAISEYGRILSENKKGIKRHISPQFEYNQYTRDFFKSNPEMSRSDCITCWNFKKKTIGNHKYETDDLKVLKKKSR